jgi:hypothetical protein
LRGPKNPHIFPTNPYQPLIQSTNFEITMSTEYTTENHAQQIRQSVVYDVITYLRTCEIPGHAITPRLVFLALESSYKAQPVFWRALDRATVLRALEVYAPGFESTLSFVEKNAYEILVDRIDFMLDVRFRDELNAEILLAAPVTERNIAFTKTHQYLLRKLTARGESKRAKTLKAERNVGPAAALELVEAQCAAREGRPFMTRFMQEAMITSHAFAINRPFDAAFHEDD